MNGLGEWRHWPALLASTLGITLAMMYVYSLGVMIAPLEAQFGWTRAQITSGPMVLAVLCLFLAPVMGLAIDRFGSHWPASRSIARRSPFFRLQPLMSCFGNCIGHWSAWDTFLSRR